MNNRLPIPVVATLSGACMTLWMGTFIGFLLDEKREWDRLSGVTLGSGVLFLADLWCVIFWFDKYIYRVSPATTLRLQFIDSWIAGMFALAAYSWNDCRAFLIVSLFAIPAFIYRFYEVYKSTTNNADRWILKKAIWLLVVGFLGALGAYTEFLFPLFKPSDEKLFLSAVPGLLSLVGIILTVLVRDELLFQTKEY